MRTTKWRTLALPRVFANWQGPLFAAGWRAAFFYTGGVDEATVFEYAASDSFEFPG